MHNVDGLLNEDGSITQIVDAILHVDGHSERTTFSVANLSKLDIILGFTWLTEHNPEINLKTCKVIMSYCPDKCHTCQKEVQEEQKVFRKSLDCIQTCRQGPFPSLAEDEPMTEFNSKAFELAPNADLGESPEDQMSEGDHLLCISMPPPSKEIQASQTTSQRLVKAHQRHVGTNTEVPEHL